jgi:hypothetical protein
LTLYLIISIGNPAATAASRVSITAAQWRTYVLGRWRIFYPWQAALPIHICCVLTITAIWLHWFLWSHMECRR